MTLLDYFHSLQHENGLGQGNQPVWMLPGNPADAVIPRILPDNHDPTSFLLSPSQIENFVIENGLLGNEAETRRKLQEREVQTQQISPCFFEGDGCQNCWIDTFYQIGAWMCPDFCGEGHNFQGHVTSTFDETKGEYVSDEAECRIDDCLSMEDKHCHLFEGNPAYDVANTNENFWTCPEVCPATLDAGSEMYMNILSPAMYGLIATVGIGVVGGVAFSLEWCSKRHANVDIEEEKTGFV